MGIRGGPPPRRKHSWAEGGLSPDEELREGGESDMIMSVSGRWVVVGFILALVVFIACASLALLRIKALEARIVDLADEVGRLGSTARDLRWSLGRVLDYGESAEQLGDRLALELANAAYDLLSSGDVQFVFRWAGARQVEIFVEFDDRVLGREINIADPERDSEMTATTGLQASEVLDELISWVSECRGERPSDHHFIPDRHGGGYRNVVLHVPAGYLWLQFDDVMIVSKIRATRTEPHPE